MLSANVYQVAQDSPEKIDKELEKNFKLNTTYNDDLYDVINKFC